MQDAGAAALRPAVPSRGGAHRAAASRSFATSRSTSAAAAATGRWRRSSTRASRASATQVGDGRVVCGLSGGVDSTVAALLLHRAIGDRLTCIFVDNGLLRLNEADAGARRASSGSACRSSSWTRPTCSSIGWRASPIRSRSARSSARAFIDVFEKRAQRARRLRLPRAGHALSGRHRERLGRRAVGRDQEPSQRRRPAGADAVQAGRAAARAVQGRSPRGRHDARPRRRVRLAPAVPGPGPGRAAARPDHARAARSAAARRRHRRRRGPQGRLVPAALAVVRRAAAGAERRRDGRRAAPTSTRSRFARSRAATA